MTKNKKKSTWDHNNEHVKDEATGEKETVEEAKKTVESAVKEDLPKESVEKAEQINEIEKCYCPNCGQIINEEDEFCLYCGENLRATVEDKTISKARYLCPNCGLPVEQDDEFCPNCGITLKEENETKEKAEKAEQIQAENKNTMYCPACGNEIDLSDDPDYCPFCGESLKDESKPNNKQVKAVKEKTPEEKKKARTVAFAIFAVLVALTAGIYFAVIRPNNLYSKAVALANVGNYQEAYPIMESLGNYKDSKEKAEEYHTAYILQIQTKAYSLISQGFYDDAISYFKSINQSNKYDRAIEECKTAICNAVANYLAAHGEIVSATKWDSIDITDWKLNEDSRSATIGLSCQSNMVSMNVVEDIKYSYNNTGLYVTEEKVTNQETKMSETLSAETISDLLDTIDSQYYFYYNTKAYKYNGNNSFTIRVVQLDDTETIEVETDYYYTARHIAYRFTVYDYTFKYDMTTGSWTQTRVNRIGNKLKIKNIHSTAIYIREYPGTDENIKGAVNVGDIVEVDAIIPSNMIDGYSEYNWFRIEEKGYWIADNTNNYSWYEWVMD